MNLITGAYGASIIGLIIGRLLMGPGDLSWSTADQYERKDMRAGGIIMLVSGVVLIALLGTGFDQALHDLLRVLND